MTYYTKQILGSDGQERTYVFCDLPNGGTKSFIADPANTDYANFKKEILADEAQLQDADGNTMTPEQAKTYVATLP
jgi:hypothetical protein